MVLTVNKGTLEPEHDLHFSNTIRLQVLLGRSTALLVLLGRSALLRRWGKLKLCGVIVMLVITSPFVVL